MGHARRRFTDEEDAKIRQMIADKVSTEAIAAELNTCRRTITSRYAAFLKQRERVYKAWSADELDKIRDMHAAGHTTKEIAAAVGRPHGTVSSRIAQMTQQVDGHTSVSDVAMHTGLSVYRIQHWCEQRGVAIKTRFGRGYINNRAAGLARRMLTVDAAPGRRRAAEAHRVKFREGDMDKFGPEIRERLKRGQWVNDISWEMDLHPCLVSRIVEKILGRMGRP